MADWDSQADDGDPGLSGARGDACLAETSNEE